MVLFISDFLIMKKSHLLIKIIIVYENILIMVYILGIKIFLKRILKVPVAILKSLVLF